MDVEKEIKKITGLSPREAVAVQRILAPKAIRSPLKSVPRLVGGADVSYRRGDKELYAAIVVWDRRSREVVAGAAISAVPGFPYVPGLLSFREIPAVLLAWKKLEIKPGLMLCDGQGYAHPRRLGLASHMGLVLGIPTVGCAKSRLCGEYREPGRKRGNRSILVDKGEQIGYVLRTKDNVKPLFVSLGHRCDHLSAIKAVLACDGGYRLPEPTRRAHLLVNEARLQAGRRGGGN